MFARLTKIALSLPFLIAAGLFGFYLVFGFFLVDPVARKVLPWVEETKLASQLSVQKVEFNPITLEATVTGLKLAEKSGQPLAGFERLYVNLETLGLFRFAWRLKDVQLSGPQADFVVRPGGKLNWAVLIAKLNEDKEPPKDTLPRVLIDHIKIDKGNINYADANRAGEPFRVQLEPLGIELDGLSTLPEDRGNYLIAATLPRQQGKLKWKGDVSLNPVKSDGEVGLEGVSLASLLAVIKTERNFELASGTLAAGMHYRFAMVKDKSGQDKPWAQVKGANLVLQNLALAPRGGGALKDSDPLRAEARVGSYAPVLELAEAKIGNANLDLASRKINVAEVSLNNARLAASRAADGTLDWQKLFAVAGDAPVMDKPATVQAKNPPKTPANAQPWKIAVDAIALKDWSAKFTDNGFSSPMRVEAEGFALDAKMHGEFGTTTAVRVEPVNAALGPVRVFSGATNVAQLSATRLENARFNLAEQRLDVDAIELSGLKTAVALDRNKQLNWNRILARSGVQRTLSSTAAVAPPKTGSSGFALNLGKLALNGINIAVSDISTPTPVNLDVVNGQTTLQNLSLDMNQPVALNAALPIRQGGNISAGGSLVPGKASGKLNFKLTGLSLKPFAPYVKQFAKLDLQSGAASTNGKLDFASGKQGLKLAYDGGFAVDDLAITEEETAEAFLGWKKLSSDSLELNLGPNRLHMNELVAINPFGKVIIFEDKTLNLKRIQRGQDKPAATEPAAPEGVAAEPAPAPAPVAAAPGKSAGNGFPLAIERLRIENANAEFADLSLLPQFGTRMHDLSGVITGLSTDPATMALVELDGKVDDYGSARMRGSIQPFRATDFTDLRLTFRNLEMNNLTPYSGKFAGRRIDSGKLSVDLEYKIKNRQLAGENKFVINKLKLGDRVDSKDAMKLPLDLAIALLEDSNGIIDLDLPISGSLDDPKFSYGKIIWKAIVNVLTKIVTAPFRAIGSLLGISADKLEAVEFDFGEDRLSPPEKEKLKNIGQALAKRPSLTLTVEPGYEVKGDTRAIQEMWVRRDVANRMGLKTEPDKEPGPVDTTNPRAQKALEELYNARFEKKGGLKALKAEYEKPKEGAKSIHAEMLERMTLIIPVTENELQRLATQRAQSVKDELVKEGKVEESRVGIAAPVKKEDGGKLVASKMSLGVGKKRAEAAPSVPAAP